MLTDAPLACCFMESNGGSRAETRLQRSRADARCRALLDGDNDLVCGVGFEIWGLGCGVWVVGLRALLVGNSDLVPRRARIQGSYTFVPLNSRRESNE